MNEIIANEKLYENLNHLICYYRQNIHRFVDEYLQIKLKLFQKIILFIMSFPGAKKETVFDWFASRGAGKSWLAMLFAVCMCILYPGTKVVVTAQNIAAARRSIKYLEWFLEKSPTLKNELLDYKNNKDGAEVNFCGGSSIFTVACTDNARGIRSNILICDERRMLNTDTINKVFRPFLTNVRSIPAYDKKEYRKYAELEHNSRIYLTSIGYADEDAYKEFENYADFISNGDDNYAIISTPYQIPVESGIITASNIESQAKENLADLSGFEMEMCVIPLGESDGAIFSHLQVNNSRTIIAPLIEPTYMEYVEMVDNYKKPKHHVHKENGEIRVMSVDIAVGAGKKNDASSWIISRNFNRDTFYDKMLPYVNGEVGMNIDEQVLKTKRLWYLFEIDYVVIDAGGAIGLSFANLLGNKTYDNQYNRWYPGFKTVNMSEKFDIRVSDPDAIPVLYCIQVSGTNASQQQTDMSFIAKMNYDRVPQRVSMLVDMQTGVEELNKKYGYINLRTSGDIGDRERSENMIRNFAHTDELVKEMLSVKLKRLPSGRFTFDEGGGRKDKFMGLLYNLHFVNKLETDLLEKSRRIDLSKYSGAITGGYQGGGNNPFAGRQSAFSGRRAFG